MLFRAHKTAHHTAKKIIIALLIVVMTTMAGTADAARKKARKAAAPQPDRYASIVMEAGTGFVISEKNPDKKLYPASLTKMMTLYLTFDAIEQGRLQKYSRIPVSKRAAFQEPSELGLVAGTSIRVEDAILGLVTKSANDAAVTLAEGIGGSEARFASLMTAKARQLGMNSTRFVNASGLHHPSQVSSARDMAILAQALMRDFPRQYRYFSTTSFTFAGKTYGNHNHLMKTYKGMDGLKTGYVYASGYNLAASAVQGGTRLIGVVFGGKTSKSRNDQMAKLLDESFAKTKDVRVARLIDARRKAILEAVQVAANTKGGKLPARKPSAVPLDTTATTAAARVTDVALNTYPAKNDPAPQFDAIGLVTEQGDADANEQVPAVTQNRIVAVNSINEDQRRTFTRDFQPRPMNVQPVNKQEIPAAAEMDKKAVKTATAANGVWSVQVGAFSSHEAGMNALQSTRGKLPDHVTGGSQYIIAPLMTNRGVIYRARLSGMAREQATQACRILQGSCLILASR